VKREVSAQRQPPTPEMRKRAPRQPRAKSAKFLTREERVQEAVKIIRECKGIKPDSCEGSVVNILDWLEAVCTGSSALRRVSSKETRRADEQVVAWLRRGVILLNNLYLWPVGFEKFRDEVKRWADMYEAERNRPVGKPKPSAYAKRFAAEAALHLCDEFGVKLTKTKRGAFCRLAAVLYGDRRADLQKHCAKVIAPNYRTSLARRQSGAKMVPV
jgi:hypothetical protein